MSDKKDERITGLPDQEPEIFGRSKSREEIKAELKAEKAARREALKKAYKAKRAADKAAVKEKRPELWFVLGLMAAIVIGCGVLLAIQFAQDARLETYEQDETRDTYYLDSEAMPELEDDGISAAINKVYYTKGGHLCVEMTLGNGRKFPMQMSALEVQIYNKEEELIGSGYTSKISENFRLEAGGTEPYTFYISPEYVRITDDPLTEISYSVEATGSEAD